MRRFAFFAVLCALAAVLALLLAPGASPFAQTLCIAGGLALCSFAFGAATGPIVWQAFNALFICGFQLALIALFSSPLARLEGGGPLGPSFALCAALVLMFLAYETEADREQWEFQRRKEALRAARDAARDAEAEAGFRSSGLFRLSRHPAYFGELGFWWSVYLLCAALSGGPLVHWSAAGAAALSLLFVGSTRFTESLSAAKYPLYAAYRASTSAVIPWFPRRLSLAEPAVQGGED